MKPFEALQALVDKFLGVSSVNERPLVGSDTSFCSSCESSFNSTDFFATNLLLLVFIGQTLPVVVTPEAIDVGENVDNCCALFGVDNFINSDGCFVGWSTHIENLIDYVACVHPHALLLVDCLLNIVEEVRYCARVESARLIDTNGAEEVAQRRWIAFVFHRQNKVQVRSKVDFAFVERASVK